MKNKKRNVILGVCICVFVLFLIIICNSITTVPTGCVGVKTRFGKVQEAVIQEGLNTKVPFIEKIVKIDCKTQKLEVESNTASKDLQDVNLKVAVNYNVTKDTANTLYKEIGKKYEDIVVNPAILESVKSVTAQYTAEELITKRADVSNSMQDLLKQKITGKGFNVVDFNITDLNFSEAYNQAIEKKQVAEQEAKQAEYELQKSQVENEKKIAEAEANARVMEVQNASTTEQAIRLKELEIQQAFINKWNGQLPTTNAGNVIPFMNVGE